MCLKKYYRPPEAMPKFLPFLDLAKVTFWTKGFVLEETIKPLGVAGGYVQFKKWMLVTSRTLWQSDLMSWN